MLRLENLDTDLRPPERALQLTRAAVDRDDANLDLARTTDVRIDDLPTFAQARVRNAIPADSFQEAEQIVRKLRQGDELEAAGKIQAEFAGDYAALKKNFNAAVKSFGRMLVDEHTKSSN